MESAHDRPSDRCSRDRSRRRGLCPARRPRLPRLPERRPRSQDARTGRTDGAPGVSGDEGRRRSSAGRSRDDRRSVDPRSRGRDPGPAVRCRGDSRGWPGDGVLPRRRVRDRGYRHARQRLRGDIARAGHAGGLDRLSPRPGSALARRARGLRGSGAVGRGEPACAGTDGDRARSVRRQRGRYADDHDRDRAWRRPRFRPRHRPGAALPRRGCDEGISVLCAVRGGITC